METSPVLTIHHSIECQAKNSLIISYLSIWPTKMAYCKAGLDSVVFDAQLFSSLQQGARKRRFTFLVLLIKIKQKIVTPCMYFCYILHVFLYACIQTADCY